MSIALKHQNKVIQKRSKIAAGKRIEAAAQETIQATASDYHAFQLLLDSLDLDINRLSGLSVDEKKRIKSEELIPKYQPYIDDYLAGDEVYQNPVLVNIMIWLFDVNDIELATRYGCIAVEQKQPVPDRFKRQDISTVVADSLLEWCDRQEKNNHSIEPYFTEIFKTIVDEKWPMPDAVLAKYYVRAGDTAFDANEYQEALKLYLRAVELDQKRTKRKTNIKKCYIQLQSMGVALDETLDETDEAGNES